MLGRIGQAGERGCCWKGRAWLGGESKGCG